MSILIVEDNEANITMLDYLLTASGHETLLARTGADGIRIATQQRPALILLDIRMPGMDGYEVMAAIKGKPELDGTLVVAVTASVIADPRDSVTSAGFDGYITKPIDPETFMAELDQFLPVRTTTNRALGEP
jgi:two-component system, cell cycle response regulator